MENLKYLLLIMWNVKLRNFFILGLYKESVFVGVKFLLNVLVLNINFKFM